ncbi:predicted protein [Histoplasma mississippiense (nom. inval.)]|uniref:predicted protein n=1 Tax=Ajellomyces capsulatus (strain NAm1 / WU24) TaxID=2059318 RepID=UPI000157BEAB|nr:predicted protein [Histoplasma mississippiense (nom. inval.)]EDN07154.1 predicted protein [Histoplasma mississippiense (nom. inval.)]
MDEVFSDPTDEENSVNSSVTPDTFTSSNPGLETNTSVSENVGDDNAHVSEENDLRISINSPPEILRGKYHSLPGKKPKPGLDFNLPPISKIEDIFDDISINAERNGFNNFLDHIGSRDLRVATMCSGTEAPLLALEMVMARSYTDLIPRVTAFGSLRKVPSTLDLLVVGFSCVDFSNMNLYRKTLDEMGESGHTFYGVLRYTQRCRPPLMILENVCGAPWGHIKDALKEIDYHAYHIKVDTKNYYLPQTRERGYMLCIDQTRLETLPPADSKSSAFAKMMKNFERPASSPVTQFLLKNDDPRLLDAIDDISCNTTKDRQAVDWTRYKARHLRYRMREGLGDKRPLTRWQDNGSCQMPDFYWHRWSKVQTERVWDTLDVNYLRSIIRGFDINFKSRIIDLSQGLDRELDQRASGVSGCLTPRGQHFVTSRGGPLLGIEALALQGIPIDRLLLGNDSQRDLNDLAGNAMSSTVVGVAIMSALIVGYQALAPGKTGGRNSKNEEHFITQMQIADNDTVELVPLHSGDEIVLSTHEVFEIGKRSSRMCICEGQALTKRTDMLICLKCGLTACKSCGRNPPHVYSPIPKDELNARVSPIDFETQLKKKLPMRLQVNGLPLALYRELKQDDLPVDVSSTWDDFFKVLLPALGDELRYQGVTRKRSWTITYTGSLSVLKFVCSSTRLQWSLYLKPPKDEPSNSPLRQVLRYPIASMTPSGKNILNGIWHITSPISSYFDIFVSGKGNVLPSIGSRAGLKRSHFADAKVWSKINISATDAAVQNLEFDIRGEYELLQDCGAASGSLHKKMVSGCDPPVYCFLDPTDIGPAEFDSWVFALSHDRLDIGEARIIIAELRPNWDSCTVSNEPESVRCWFRKTTMTDMVSLDIYSPSPFYQTTTPKTIATSIGSKCLNSYVPMLVSSIPATGAELSWEPGTWKVSNLMESPAVLRKLSWLLQPASSVKQFSEWTGICLDNEECGKECDICAPRKPRLLWALDEKDRIYAYEDPEDAAVYEQSIKKRPATFLGFTRFGHDSILQVKLCLNVITLIHQARGKLVKKEQVSQVSLEWRVCIDNVGFLRQRLPMLKEQNNKGDIESTQPPGFKFFNLRPEQLRSLTWMKEQEDMVQPFQEEEVVEAMLPAINWRAEAKATVKHFVRGGILGDDVGYGKTAITLGLIDYQFTKDVKNVPRFVKGAIPIKATLIVVPHHLIDQWSREITKFLGKKYNVLEIKSIASLRSLTILRFEIADIVLLSTSVIRGASYYERMELFAATSAVPKGDGRIFDEWLSDATAAVRDHVDLLLTKGPEVVLHNMIQKQADFRNSGVFSRFQPSRRLKGRKFQDHLLNLKKKMQKINNDSAATHETVNDSETKLNIVQSKLQNKKRKTMEYDRGNEPDIANSEATKAPQAKKSKRIGPGSEFDKTFQLLNCNGDWKRMRSPLIHMFEYSRIVIDEFTYSKDRNYSSVLSIPARSK